jgi:DNA-binding NarL/FixJ family response regulator
MTALERIKVLVCYDNPVLLAGLMATLACHGDLDCTASDGATLAYGYGAMPDVIIADHCHGIELARACARLAGPHSRPRVLVVTHSDRECDVRAALSGGAQGYLLIDDVPDLLVSAIRGVRPGGRVLSPKVASRLADNVALEPLTQREEAVLVLVVEGLCNKVIGSRLGITAGTVKSHLRSAFGKLGATSRTQAVAIAHRRGLLQLRTEGGGLSGTPEAPSRRPLPPSIGMAEATDPAPSDWPGRLPQYVTPASGHRRAH